MIKQVLLCKPIFHRAKPLGSIFEMAENILRYTRGAKRVVHWRDKINATYMLDRTLKFCTFSYKAILYIISNYQFICMNENEDIVFF